MSDSRPHGPQLCLLQELTPDASEVVPLPRNLKLSKAVQTTCPGRQFEFTFKDLERNTTNRTHLREDTTVRNLLQPLCQCPESMCTNPGICWPHRLGKCCI